MANILSIDPFNNNSGPGIRVLVIFSNDNNCIDINSKELLNEIRRYRHYIEMNNGGVTFSGNIENNIDYLKEMCILCHKSNIKTCIEMDSKAFNLISPFLKYVDYVIIHSDDNNIDNIIFELEKNKIDFLLK